MIPGKVHSFFVQNTNKKTMTDNPMAVGCEEAEIFLGDCIIWEMAFVEGRI